MTHGTGLTPARIEQPGGATRIKTRLKKKEMKVKIVNLKRAYGKTAPPEIKSAPARQLKMAA